MIARITWDCAWARDPNRGVVVVVGTDSQVFNDLRGSPTILEHQPFGSPLLAGKHGEPVHVFVFVFVVVFVFVFVFVCVCTCARDVIGKGVARRC